MKLLSAGNHVEDVEVLRLLTLSAFIAGITPDTHTHTHTHTHWFNTPSLQVAALLTSASLAAARVRHTPAGGHVVFDLTLPVNTEAGVAVGAGDRHPRIETVAVVQTRGF